MVARISNASPKVIFSGVQDLSSANVLPEREARAQHTAIFYAFTESGKELPEFVDTATAKKLYGDMTFDSRGPFYNHQLATAEMVMATGNKTFLKRVIPADAKRASVRIGIEIAPNDIKQYVRDDAGRIARHLGVKIPLLKDGVTATVDVDGHITNDDTDIEFVVGYLARWVQLTDADIPADKDAGFAYEGTLVGSVNSVATASVIYPITQHICDFGKFGNDRGIRFGSAATGNVADADEALMVGQEGLMYNYQPVARNKAGTVDVIRNNFGERETKFAFKDGFYNPTTDVDYGIVDMVKMFETISPGITPTYGPFDSVTVFEGNLKTVLDMLTAAETTAIAALPIDPMADPIPAITDSNLFGFMDNLSARGAEHYAMEFDATSKKMALTTTFFAEGGEDGDISLASLEERIEWEMANNWENPAYPLVSRARFPLTRIYDTGFKMSTKVALMKAMAYSPAISFVGGVQDLALPRFSAIEERAAGILLNAAATAYQESEEFGTPTMRAVLFRQTYRYENAKFKGFLTGVTDFAIKCAKFGGSGDGKLRAAENYSLPGNNLLEGVLDLNDAWLPDVLVNANWENSINGAVDRNRSTFYYPTLQTVFNNDTSTLNNPIVMGIYGDLVHVCDYIHTKVTGRSDLDDAQILALYKSEFEAATKGSYAGMVNLEVVPFYTPNDKLRNYSTSINITLYANGTKTVSVFNFINKRNA